VNDTDKELVKKRHWARRLAVQAIYQWCLTGNSTEDIQAEFASNKDFKKTDNEYFTTLTRGVLDHPNDNKNILEKHLDRPFNQLNPIEEAVLRYSTYELINFSEIPHKVIISEAVILAKKFGSQDGYKYINAVLESLTNEYRRDG